MYKDKIRCEKPQPDTQTSKYSKLSKKQLEILGTYHRKTAEYDAVHSGKIARFPSSSQYPGVGERTKCVRGGRSISIRPDGFYDGLYTTGVNACTALVMVAKSEGGKVIGVALSHILPFPNESYMMVALQEVFCRKAQAARLEFTVIGGKQTAPSVLKLIKEFGQVNFEHVEEDLKISHSLVVDKNGKIYYGRRMDLDIFCVD